MRALSRLTRGVGALVVVVASGQSPAWSATDSTATEQEYPLARGKLSLVDSPKPDRRRVVFKARWQASSDSKMENPTFAGSILRISGEGATDGDSGLIQLSPSRWHALGRPPGSAGYRYEDASQSAGGIRSIVVKRGRRSGVLKVVGGSANWRYAIAAPQTAIVVSLKIGEARWCAEFRAPFERNVRRRVVARSGRPPESCPCDRFESTFGAIQKVIFERHGCTQAVCHGGMPPQGGLDLHPEVAYGNLIDVPSSALPSLKRVEPGDQARSLLWLKLAKSTLGLANVPGTGMPQNLPPIPENELEALRLWIRAGAPANGVVGGTETLLDSCLPPADPIKIRPPDPPAPSEGVQLHAPPWIIPAGGELEVCYATYYDFSAQIPASAQTPCHPFWGGPERQCFFLNRSELTQDPNSHHSIIHLYKNLNNYDITDPDTRFGPFTCAGGANHGQPCNPLGIGQPAPAGADCGEGSGCAGQVVPSIACILYGPDDYGFDLSGSGTSNAPSIGGSQQPLSQSIYPPEVFGTLPVKGVVVWNSHAFNLTDRASTNEQWLNIYFAGPTDRVYVVESIFDASSIFVQNVPPFEKREYCKTYTLPQGARLFQLSSHTHKRGELFRIWGPGIAPPCNSQGGDVCDPEPGPPIFTTTDYSDPMVLTFDPPLEFDQADPATRTYKFCSRYDNGADNPQEVKRRSTSPLPTSFFAPGGPCAATAAACLDGPRRGQSCNGDDRACDSEDADDGQCDACPLLGGVTTEDEMFILLGLYYRVPVP